MTKRLVKSILGEKTESESDSVTIMVKGEGARQFREFMEQVANLCNAGSSRRLGIEDPSDDDERGITWDFDGDGNTRIEVVGTDSSPPEP